MRPRRVQRNSRPHDRKFLFRSRRGRGIARVTWRNALEVGKGLRPVGQENHAAFAQRQALPPPSREPRTRPINVGPDEEAMDFDSSEREKFRVVGLLPASDSAAVRLASTMRDIFAAGRGGKLQVVQGQTCGTWPAHLIGVGTRYSALMCVATSPAAVAQIGPDRALGFRRSL